MSRREAVPGDNLSAGARWRREYSDVYTRTVTTWQTRRGRRNSEFSTFSNLLGLNTSFDDLHKADGESPYLRNVRYMGEKQQIQRAQVTSRCGAKFLGELDYETTEALPEEYEMELYEGKAIEIDLTGKDLFIGGALWIKNINKATGRLRIYLRENYKEKAHYNPRPICDACIDLTKVSQVRFDKRVFRFINPLKLDKTPFKRGLTLRMEIEGDVEYPDCGSNPEARKIVLKASGRQYHREAIYEKPNVTECLREKPYEWTEEPGYPCIEVHTTDKQAIPSAALVCTEEGKFTVFPIKEGGKVNLYRFNLDTKEYTLIDTTEAPVDKRAKAVRFAQGLGKLYFVDGYSYLQRIDLSTWKSELAIAKQEDIDVEDVTPEDMQAQPGASLILRIRQRIYLAGFKEDPNFVQYSIINSLTGTTDEPSENAGVQYDQFSDISWFYSPDKSPKDSVCAGITALAQYENNLIIFREDGSSVYQIGSEFSAPAQEDIYSYNIGVARQEDVTNSNGNLFLYNKSEGIRRFSGAEATFQSVKIDNELRKIPDDSPRFMFAHANKVRFYCDVKNRGYADHSFIYMTALSQSSPWYCDDNTPVTWVIADQTSDRMFAMHALYPCVYEVDAADNYADFDSSINMAYDTQYKSPGSMNGYTLLRRVILRIIASSTLAWFIGIDVDHSDNPSVWKKYVKAQVDEEKPVESIFENTADAGTTVVNLMMREKVKDYQVRIRVSTFDAPAMLQYISSEVGSVRSL